MDMQDKDFDELFRAKLDGFETEPSANVWPGIAGELGSAKRRRSLAPWLSLAASIVVLTGLGLFFSPKKTNTSMKPPVKSGNTTASSLPSASVIQNPAFQRIKPSQIKARTGKLNRSNEIARVPNSRLAIGGQVKNVDTTSAPPKALKRDDQQLVADMPQNHPA